MWKKWAIWFKGALIGLIIGFLISLGLVSDNAVLSKVASPGFETCKALSDCQASLQCEVCRVIGLMFNLFYGFAIGAIIGLVIEKIIKPKNKKNKR